MSWFSRKRLANNCLSLVLMAIGAVILVMAAVLLQPVKPVAAVSSDLRNVITAYPFVDNTDIDSCDICHTASIPGLNNYGRAYRTAGENVAALRAIEGQDSDGDGFTNLVEINALTFPGDADSRPAQQPTAVPPTAVPPTEVPPTAVPPTDVPPTDVPPTDVPPTDVPPTSTATVVAPPPEATATPTPEESVTATPTLIVETGTAVPTGEVTATAEVTASATAVGTSVPTGVPTTLMLIPEADTHVRYNRRSTNYGKANTMRVDNSPIARAYLRFAIVENAGLTVTSAKLRVFVTESSDRGFSVRAVQDDDWSEEMLYRNRPDYGETVGRANSTNKGEWVTVDITAYVQAHGPGPLSVAIYGDSTNGLTLAARESGGNAPQLIVEYGP